MTLMNGDIPVSLPATGHEATATPEDARVAASLDHWKRKLLDVSKRNRALNFRPTKASTLAMVDEQPAEVFRTLCTDGKPMRFHAAAAPPTAPPAPESAPPIPTPDEGEEVELPASAAYVPYAATSLDSRHTDDALQTNVSADVLDRTLRRIETQARETIEEQGVNTLFLALGMLHYKEAEASEEVWRAPLVLIPVELQRSSARAAYTVRATEDDPLVNPALVEYLRRTFGLALPDLFEGADGAEDRDLQRFFSTVTETIREHPGWQVKTDVVLSFFSFQKFVMYKDLEANTAFRSHPLVRQIVLRSGNSVRSLPEDVRTADLDAEFAPEAAELVTNADGSQLRAILAARRGHSLVLEGPPGTGKSQTITNLIAQALAQGKSVLFVAEKMAALEVVHSRLVDAGLGEFCLELHSSKANKRSVMREIGATLDLSLQRPPAGERNTARMAQVRAELTTYAQGVHQPFGSLGWTPYRAYGELELVREAPRVRLEGAITQITAEQLADAQRFLDDLAEAATPLGNVAEHPWRDSRRTFYSEDDRERAQELLTALREHLPRVIALAEQVGRDFGFPPITTFADVQTAGALAAALARSPGAPVAVLESEAWNSPPRQAVELVRQGRELKAEADTLAGWFGPDVHLQRHADDIAYMEAKESGLLRFLNGLDGRYRGIKRRWLSYRFPTYQRTLTEQAADLRRVDALAGARAELQRRDAEGGELFGALWQGEQSDWEALAGYVSWVVEFRKLCVAHGLREQAVATAARPQPDVSAVEALRSDTAQLREYLAAFRALVQWPDGYLEAATFPEIAARVEALLNGMALAPRWATFAAAQARVEGTPAAELLPRALGGELAFPDLSRTFRRAFIQKWLTELVQEREPLREFHTLTHEQRVAEFRRLDEQVLLENRTTLVAKLRDQVQAGLRTPDAVAALPFLRRQLTLQRNLSPLRVTMQRAGAAIRAIKPVFMMSPLTVAQLLDGSFPPFDLVIFDEASQLPAEDAVGAIARGEQLVVVGDPKQLPPTNFFSVMSGTVSAPMGEDGLPLFEDSESILEEFGGSGAPSTRLRWHYRSLHEALIHFSNVSFYDADLYTFPSVETHSHGAGLSFEWVPEGVYEGKGLNQAEARRVVDAVVRHAKTCPELSLAVGTFNLRQQLAIQDELEARRREDPSLEPFFARGKKEPFFVKNLENIQGDERDVIFLSVTYGKDSNGVLRYNFGPLNGENGWRRLNVLTTRARRQMRVFASIKGDDINPVQATSLGPKLLRDFLLYAEYGRLDSAVVAAAAQTESVFEREVYLELTRRGLRLQPQVGVGGYRIDFGVLDEEVAGRFVCGIECDGVTYHASETARDRDRLRQQVLEARGWTIHRLWSTDWFKDREGQIERLLELVAKTRDACRKAEAAAAEEKQMAAAPPAPAEIPPQPDLGEAAAPVASLPAMAEASPYTFAPAPRLHEGEDFTAAPAEQVWQAVSEVVAVEAPLHLTDLAVRVTARWGAERVGPRMMRHLRGVVETAAQQQFLELRGDFVHAAGAPAIPPRTRAGTGIPAERIPPEEYREAVLLALRAGPLDRKLLMNRVRALFGFSRTGATLDAAIGKTVDALLAEQVLGEGSTGICLRQ